MASTVIVIFLLGDREEANLMTSGVEFLKSKSNEV